MRRPAVARGDEGAPIPVELVCTRARGVMTRRDEKLPEVGASRFGGGDDGWPLR
jgi:hypothetical protein